MKTSEFLSHLRSLDIRVSLEDGALKVKAPKGALTGELREELGRRKEEILRALDGAGFLVPSGDGAQVSEESILRAERAGPIPLSATQQRLWFLEQMEPGMVTYNMWATIEMRGPLDLDALDRGLTEIVRRHEVLRTTFTDEAGIPAQVVGPPVPVTMERLGNFDGRTDEISDEAIRALLWKRQEVPFDLARGPMVRPAIVRVTPTRHVFFMTIHHIVCDGLSMGIFFRELSALYAAYVAGEESPLPELPVQYADYSIWQKRYFEGPAFQRQREYWLKTLGGELPLLELPLDKTRPAIQTYDGGVERRWFSRRLSDALQVLVNREGATLFMVLLAAYKAFLARYTGQRDILVGTAMGNRNRGEVEDMIGFFVNTLVFRTDLSGDPSFRELIAKVRESFVGAMEHQDMPFERLVDELQLERNLSYSPIFQTLFVLDQDAGYSRMMGDIELEPFILDYHQTRTDLVINAYRGRDGVCFAMEYNTDLFEAATVRRMLGHFEVLLEAAVDDPDLRLSQLPIQGAAERKKVLADWNDTACEFSQDPIHVQFEAQVDATPDAVALIYPGAEEEVLSYRELDRRANRLAHLLAERGVRPETLVGLCLDRSVDMLVAALAIQKAGCAYVPLDPGFPVDRLAYMVEDAKVAVIVTHTDQIGVLPDAGVELVRLDTLGDELAVASPERRDSGVDCHARMYVIYTSGSTGRPKGVELEHRSVSNFLASMRREPGFRAGERLLAVTTLSFDISKLELFMPLLSGGTVIVAPKAATADGEQLAGLLERYRPEVMQATPATWRMLLLNGWEGAPGLRIFSGGEALPRDLADDLLQCGQELWNLYGPTEATIWSTVCRVEPAAGPVTIGKPIANTQIYVLDEHGQPAPVGVPGELYIAGDGLARGYLERPELTAERFRPDPFADTPGARMYWTGDLARWLPSGEIECLGRIDNQVKLRGFRIELGEIEAVLTEDPAVHECAVIVREDTPGDQRLFAYYVAEADAEVDVKVLREGAHDKLPAYMVPGSYVQLDALPLTPNAKVDRLALKRMKAEVEVAAVEYVAPRNELEGQIAEVWGEMLKLERVNVHTNFFDLGGHSLLLAQLRVKLQQVVDPDVSIIELFQFPTVSGLATHIAERRSKQGAGGQAGQRGKRGSNLAAGRKKLMRRRRVRE